MIQDKVKQLLSDGKAAWGKRFVFPFRMADGRGGEKFTGRLTFWGYHLHDKDKRSVDINGESVDQAKINRFPAGKPRGDLPGQRFEISLAGCPPFRGNNELGLTVQSSINGKHLPYMEELEVVVNKAE